MTRLLIGLSFIILLLNGCTSNNSSNNRVPGQPYIDFEGSNGNGVKKIYNAQGKLETEVPYKDSLPDGIQKEYYKTGELFRETPFVLGKATGVVKEYSKTGKIYREMPVENGKANGVVKKYYDNGNLFSEAPFVDGKPAAGLKEYNEKGTLLSKPTLVFSAKNTIAIDGCYTIEAFLSDKNINADYFQILMYENKEIINKLPNTNGNGVLKLNVPRGAMFVKKVTFEAKYTTSRGNVCIIRGYYDLVVNN